MQRSPSNQNFFKIKILSLFFCLLEGTTAFSSTFQVIDRMEASVNASVILWSDVKKLKETIGLRTQLDPLFAGTPLATKGAMASDAEMIDFLIDEKLITQQFPKTNEEVEKEISAMLTHTRFNQEGLKKTLRDEGFSYENYFEIMRNSASKRDLLDRDIRTKVSVSENDIKNYFYHHHASGQVPQVYHLQIISSSDSSFQPKPRAHVLAEKNIIKAQAELKHGEPFEEVAKRISDDPSASTGGDLGDLDENEMSAEFLESAKKLKIGEISSILESPSKTRFYILKLVNINSNESPRLHQIKDEIRNELTTQEYKHQIALWLERQRQLAFIHTRSKKP
jgi:peptidyl-prolyl cis-trans isomerase SurA